MTFRKSTLLAKAITIALLGVVGSFAGGCAIHSQSPVKEVAYDFSDADFYDRDYAPSPNYASNYEEVTVELPVAGADASVQMLARQPAE